VFCCPAKAAACRGAQTFLRVRGIDIAFSREGWAGSPGPASAIVARARCLVHHLRDPPCVSPRDNPRARHATVMERTGGAGLDVTQRCMPWSAPHKNYQLAIFRPSIAKFLIAASFVTSVTPSASA
jgi:hypothetical protein